MALPTEAAMAEDITVSGGYRLRFSARSPTDGSAVTGVVVSLVNVSVDMTADEVPADEVGPFLLVPGVNT